MDDWTRYAMTWKPGMPVICYPTESLELLGVLTYLRWLRYNPQVFEQANLDGLSQLCGTQQIPRCVPPCFRTDSVPHCEFGDKKKPMREILEEHLDEVIGRSE